MSSASADLDSCVSAGAIRSHYDLGNAFYSLWLDPSMTYSCALWNHEEESLEAAQINKIDWHLSRCTVPTGGRLLEIGSGWGALLERAVGSYGVKEVTTLTLSLEQARWISARNLPGVKVQLESWVDHKPTDKYDGIVSVEAFEAFARADQTEEQKLEGYRSFFRSCHRWLQPGGRLAMQTIFSERPTRDADCFLGREIFQEADLPHLDEIVKAAQGLFEIEILVTDRAAYCRTLRTWLSGLRTKSEEATALVGRDAVDKYRRYLGVCIVGFHTGAMNLARIALRRVESVGA